jgi:hypothetical protein
MEMSSVGIDLECRSESRKILDEQISRLPSVFRHPNALC